MARGLYFVRMSGQRVEDSHKMTLLKRRLGQHLTFVGCLAKMAPRRQAHCQNDQELQVWCFRTDIRDMSHPVGCRREYEFSRR